MKFNSPKDFYEEQAQKYEKHADWEDLSDKSKEYWINRYRDCRKYNKKEIEDDLTD